MTSAFRNSPAAPVAPDRTSGAPVAALTGLPGAAAELTVIVVSYTTRDLTLACLRTLLAVTHVARAHVVVFDTASSDGSAEAVAAAFPQVELIAGAENLGFARANSVVAQVALRGGREMAQRLRHARQLAGRLWKARSMSEPPLDLLREPALSGDAG